MISQLEDKIFSIQNQLNSSIISENSKKDSSKTKGSSLFGFFGGGKQKDELSQQIKEQMDLLNLKQIETEQLHIEKSQLNQVVQNLQEESRKSFQKLVEEFQKISLFLKDKILLILANFQFDNLYENTNTVRNFQKQIQEQVCQNWNPILKQVSLALDQYIQDYILQLKDELIIYQDNQAIEQIINQIIQACQDVKSFQLFEALKLVDIKNQQIQKNVQNETQELQQETNLLGQEFEIQEQNIQNDNLQAKLNMKQNNQNYQEIFQKQSKLLFERAEKLTLLFDDIFIKQKKKLMLEASWMQNQINNNGSGEENNGIHIQEMENIKQIISFNNDKIECYSQIKENFDQIIFQTKQIAQAIVFEQQGLKNIQISLYNQLFFYQNFDEFPLGYENIKTNQQTIKNLENKLLYQNKQIQSFKQALTQAEKQIQDFNKQNSQQYQQQQHKLQIQEQNENDLKNMQKNQEGLISSELQDIDKQQIQNQNVISKKEDLNVMQNLENQNIDVLTGQQRVTVKLENSLNQILQLGEIQNSGSQEILTQLFEKSKEKIYNLILLNDQLEKKQEEYLLQVEKMKTILEKEQDEKKQLEIDIKVLQHKYKMPLN